MVPSLDKLQRKLGYQFNDIQLLTQSLTHRSHSSKNNERLEFLGDSILNFVVGASLFGMFERADEGQLSRLRAKMVRQSTLADVARDMSLGDYLILGVGELKSGGFRRDSILSDALEAIIGAMFLDSNLDQVTTHVNDWYEERLSLLSLEQPLKDAKSRLQEFLQSRQVDLPVYSLTEVRGQAHEQVFTIACQCQLLEKAASGKGNTRRAAEQAAASTVLETLGIEFDNG